MVFKSIGHVKMWLICFVFFTTKHRKLIRGKTGAILRVHVRARKITMFLLEGVEADKSVGNFAANPPIDIPKLVDFGSLEKPRQLLKFSERCLPLCCSLRHFHDL